MKNKNILSAILILVSIIFNICHANTQTNLNHFIYKETTIIIVTLIFILCYTLIILEEKIKIKKSTISILFASIIWIILTIKTSNETKIIINYKIQEILYKYCELFLFLFITITYINIIKKLEIIENIKNIIIKTHISHKKLYWISGFLAFFISPIADNLTTALIVCSIIISIEKHDKNFINLTSINIVIAANAGGVFSPFGDITTLLIWQNNLVHTKSFFLMFVPALINFIIPALIISKKIEEKKIIHKKNTNKYNTKIKILIIISFILTIMITIFLQTYLNLPSIIGMLLGFSMLNIIEKINNKTNKLKIYVHNEIKNIDWDTLLFFIGIMLCIGGLAITGVLNATSTFIYQDMIKSITLEYKYIIANSIIGILSAIIDNIPLTFALLEMNIKMSEWQWLLVTLTTGTGGSLLSIGSAAGIALMGFTKGTYNFISHLKWTWAITLGYITSILTHLIINKDILI